MVPALAQRITPHFKNGDEKHGQCRSQTTCCHVGEESHWKAMGGEKNPKGTRTAVHKSDNDTQKHSEGERTIG